MDEYVRRLSFFTCELATGLTGTHFDGIAASGVLWDCAVPLDTAVMTRQKIAMSAGLRAARLLLPSVLLTERPNVNVVPFARDAL